MPRPDRMFHASLLAALVLLFLAGRAAAAYQIAPGTALCWGPVFANDNSMANDCSGIEGDINFSGTLHTPPLLRGWWDSNPNGSFNTEIYNQPLQWNSSTGEFLVKVCKGYPFPGPDAPYFPGYFLWCVRNPAGNSIPINVINVMASGY